VHLWWMIALAPLPPSACSKIQPEVMFWISIGMTIIMLTMPMYTPERSRGTILATMMYGMPIMDAHAIPSPIMGTSRAYSFVMLPKVISEIVPIARAAAPTTLAPNRAASGIRPIAAKMVTKL
jgi:hypothetical protein